MVEFFNGMRRSQRIRTQIRGAQESLQTADVLIMAYPMPPTFR
jgi:hypothetical protein